MAKFYPLFKFSGSSFPFSVVMPNGETRKFSYCRRQAHSNIPDEVALILEKEIPKRFNIVSYDNPKLKPKLNILPIVKPKIIVPVVEKPKPVIIPVVVEKKEEVKIYTEQELIQMEEQMGFREFRKWAKPIYNTTDRSTDQLIREILEVQRSRNG